MGSISLVEAAELIDSGDWVYLDVRGHDEQRMFGIPALPEHAKGLHTVTSHRPVPGGPVTFNASAWLAEVQALLPDRQQKVVVVCAAGVRSKAAGRAMLDAGYTQVKEVSDGFNGWRASGLPITRPPRP